MGCTDNCACFWRGGDRHAAHALPSTATVAESRARNLIKSPKERGYQSFTEEQPRHSGPDLALAKVTPSGRTTVPKPPPRQLHSQPQPQLQHHHVFGAGVTILDTHGLHTGWARNPTGNSAEGFVNLATLQCRQQAVPEQQLMPTQLHDYIPHLSHIDTVRGRLSSTVCRKVLDHVSDCMGEVQTTRKIEYTFEEFIKCAGPVFRTVAKTVNDIFEQVLASNNGSIVLSLASAPNDVGDRAVWESEVGPNWQQDVWLDDKGPLRELISINLSTASLHLASIPKGLQMSLKQVLGCSDVIDLAVALYTMKVLARLQRPQHDLPLLTVGYRVAFLREFHSSIEFRGGGKCKTCLILVPAMVDIDDGVVIKAIVHGL